MLVIMGNIDHSFLFLIYWVSCFCVERPLMLIFLLWSYNFASSPENLYLKSNRGFHLICLLFYGYQVLSCFILFPFPCHFIQDTYKRNCFLEVGTMFLSQWPFSKRLKIHGFQHPKLKSFPRTRKRLPSNWLQVWFPIFLWYSLRSSIRGVDL